MLHSVKFKSIYLGIFKPGFYKQQANFQEHSETNEISLLK